MGKIDVLLDDLNKEIKKKEPESVELYFRDFNRSGSKGNKVYRADKEGNIIESVLNSDTSDENITKLESTIQKHKDESYLDTNETEDKEEDDGKDKK